MLIESKKISELLRLYVGTEVKGVKLLSDLRENLSSAIPESYLYELMEQGVLEPIKVSRPVGNYLFKIRSENLVLAPPLSIKNHENSVKILATYPRGVGFEEIDGVSKLYPQLIMLLSGAKHSIDIINPYYTEKGSQKVSNALVQATLKGIKIRMVSRSSPSPDGLLQPTKDYLRLVNFLKEQGAPMNIEAKIFGSPDLVKGDLHLHAKAICVDGSRCYVGSANLTGPSLDSNLEIGVLLGSDQAISVYKLFCIAWKNSVRV